jgi:hypothetical protein
MGRTSHPVFIRGLISILRFPADNWAEDGSLARIDVWGLLPYRDNLLVESIARITGAEASIYTVDKTSGQLMIGTTTLEGEAGARALGGTLDPDGPVLATLRAGRTYDAREVLEGKTYFTSYKDVVRKDEIVGVLRAAVPYAQVKRERDLRSSPSKSVASPKRKARRAGSMPRSTCLSSNRRRTRPSKRAGSRGFRLKTVWWRRRGCIAAALRHKRTYNSHPTQSRDCEIDPRKISLMMSRVMGDGSTCTAAL